MCFYLKYQLNVCVLLLHLNIILMLYFSVCYRGAFETPKGSTADPGKDGSYRTSSQDDSVVYNESKTKGAIKHRPSRRGDSFK